LCVSWWGEKKAIPSNNPPNVVLHAIAIQVIPSSKYQFSFSFANHHHIIQSNIRLVRLLLNFVFIISIHFMLIMINLFFSNSNNLCTYFYCIFPFINFATLLPLPSPPLPSSTSNDQAICLVLCRESAIKLTRRPRVWRSLLSAVTIQVEGTWKGLMGRVESTKTPSPAPLDCQVEFPLLPVLLDQY
jgi:hypothetical protein